MQETICRAPHGPEQAPRATIRLTFRPWNPYGRCLFLSVREVRVGRNSWEGPEKHSLYKMHRLISTTSVSDRHQKMVYEEGVYVWPSSVIIGSRRFAIGPIYTGSPSRHFCWEPKYANSSSGARVTSHLNCLNSRSHF